MTRITVRPTRVKVWGAAGLLLSITQLACASAPDSTAALHDTPVAVSIQTVAATDQPEHFEVGGAVHAQTTAALTSRIVAPVLEVRVAPGDRVRVGDVLIVLEGRDLAAAARSMEGSVEAARHGIEAAAADERAAHASLRLAQAMHERIVTLAGKRSATPQELDEASAALAAADARNAGAAARAREAASALDSARAALETAGATESFTRITAPFDGLVTQRMVEAGNMSMPGTPLVVLEDTRHFRLEIRVDESRARDVAMGASVPVFIDGAGPTSEVALDGTVSEVARAIDSGTHTALIKVALPDRPWMRAGMFGRARLPGPSRATLTVPSEAVVRRGQVSTVFTVEQDVARLRMVNLSGLEVLSGLSAGERVIVKPPAGLADGQRVREGAR